jgi:predicted phosphodiesterase/pyruvate-formate lyase-activating enzyme
MSEIRVLRMDGPVLVFGGPYSNLEATRALFDWAAARGVPADHIICTGDVVAYGADARETLALVRQSGIHVVMGNCEESLAANAATCGCGYAEGTACQRLAAEWYAHADRSLGDEDRRWLGTLPRRLVVELAGRRLTVVHGGVSQINRFVFASAPAAVKRAELAGTDGDGVISGHSGMPFTQIIDGRLWHNAGAIGMPANDGTARTWFSLLVPEGDGIRIEHKALDYDCRIAAQKMRSAGLPEGYARALETGHWPSLDVLPPAEIAETGRPIEPGAIFWPNEASGARSLRHRNERAPAWPAITPAAPALPPRDPRKFRDPLRTLGGERRAQVGFHALETLWFNTGTLCNIACEHCYIESNPRNDRLSYLTLGDVRLYLDEIEGEGLPTAEIGLTGGEPFMNPDVMAILEECLVRGFRVLVLTNAMRPMMRHEEALLSLRRRFREKLMLRVSLDHYTQELHEKERGERTWQPALDGLLWLARQGFSVTVAGRLMWGETETSTRQGFLALFAAHGLALDADDPNQLILFPEMDAAADVPEIAEETWPAAAAAPEALMCASSRMVVKRRGAERPAVVACTLLPYEPEFELGATLAEASRAVALNHPHCARFCVLGSGSCGRG